MSSTIDQDTSKEVTSKAHQKAWLLYDSRMEMHADLDPDSHQIERPERIISIIESLSELSSKIQTKRNSCPFITIESLEPASLETIELVHSKEYIQRLAQTSTMKEEQLKEIKTIDCTIQEEENMENDEDMYFNSHTFLSARLACAGVIASIEATLSSANAPKRALAIVRPPGHHACFQKAMGFCFFNSVVVAAKHALHTGKSKKVVILDWDIHHGNGTQDLTYDDENILYISMHRYGKKCGDLFFPGTGTPKEVGGNENNLEAIGTNVNLAWTCAHMGNSEYAAAMSELILPLIHGFGADLVLVSCGLDAAKGDLIGDCDLLPSMYYSMTQSILETVGNTVPVVVALEGGYNTSVIAECMSAIALALLNEDWRGEQSASIGNIPKSTDVVSIVEKMDRDCDKEIMQLKKGREALIPVYNYYASESTNRGNVKNSAIKDINKTIRCLKSTPMWHDRDLFQTIPLQFEKVDRVTRQSSRRNKKSVDDVDIMDISFQSMTL